MPRFTRRLARAAGRVVEEAETRLLVAEGRKSVRAKVARVKKTAKKALKAGVIVGAVVATAVVMRDRRKRRALEG